MTFLALKTSTRKKSPVVRAVAFAARGPGFNPSCFKTLFSFLASSKMVGKILRTEGGAVAEMSKVLLKRDKNIRKPKRSQVRPPGLGTF